jgi:hypothetical protein
MTAAGERAIVPPQADVQAPYTWEQLATIPGAIAATLLIAQYLKFPLDRVWKIPTRFLVLIIAFGLMTLARGMVQNLNWIDVPLIAVNAFVVALAAMGAYEVSSKSSKANDFAPASSSRPVCLCAQCAHKAHTRFRHRLPETIETRPETYLTDWNRRANCRFFLYAIET